MKRRQLTPDFKARVALTALREDTTVRQIGVQYGMNSNQVRQWNQEAREGLSGVLERGAP